MQSSNAQPARSRHLVTTRQGVAEVTAHRQPARAGILMVNLGTPDAPTAKALRPYLKQFLGDPRVVEVPRPIWWLILNGVILPFRAPKSAKAYAEVWTNEGSPLLFNNRRLAEKLATELEPDLPDVSLELAMSYGQPSIQAALERMKANNVQRLLVLPMYPQYSATTTASVFDQVTTWMQGQRFFPELRFINDFYRESSWQEAIADSVRRHQAEHGKPDKLLFSFHGIPKRNLQAGDPYYCQCQFSARKIAERLNLGEDDWQVSFQSRLGRAEWLKPYTDHTLEALGHAGVKKLQVICPGFSIDCLETLEEIAMEGKEEFVEAGGEDLQYIPCLNESDDHVAVLKQLCLRHGQGWPEFEGRCSEPEDHVRTRLEQADKAAVTLNLE
ncbi:ferrochelatase [Wenzhouxiangella limi]|uniref:Ferrochelatase n=1 Tax=Wenzhouxiangella limi TaxID=2707351 RepID=A0A845UVL9_9GAMM|nr:ferrochelatase [Wenzhouxiangella limi]NDY95873.1 ferrochelatase [Wenzhouxiangella limi]